MLRIVLLLGTLGSVIDRALGDPFADLLDLDLVQGVVLLRHLRLAIDRSDDFDQQTLVWLARDDGSIAPSGPATSLAKSVMM